MMMSEKERNKTFISWFNDTKRDESWVRERERDEELSNGDLKWFRVTLTLIVSCEVRRGSRKRGNWREEMDTNDDNCFKSISFPLFSHFSLSLSLSRFSLLLFSKSVSFAPTYFLSPIHWFTRGSLLFILFFFLLDQFSLFCAHHFISCSSSSSLIFSLCFSRLLFFFFFLAWVWGREVE